MMRLLRVLLSLFVTALACPAHAATTEVKVGAYVHDIQDLDLKTHSYGLDVYFWFRWRDPSFDPSERVEFMNPFELWEHTLRRTYEKPQRMPNGELYQVIRLQGRFSHKFDLSLFPFDRQEIVMELEDSRDGAKGLRFVADSDPVTMSPAIRLPGFRLGAPVLEIKPVEYPTRFGDIRESAAKTTFTRVNVSVPIVRPVAAYTLKFMMPILCVVFCAGLMFLFRPTYVESRVGIGITALLTIVALQITLNEDLPEVDYLVLIDKIYLGAYLYVIAGLTLIMRTTWMLDRSAANEARARLADLKGMAVLTTLYLGLVLSLILTALPR